MKSIKKSIVIVTALLGLGVITNASATQSYIEDSLNKFIVDQGEQVSRMLAIQLKQQITSNLQQISDTVSVSVKDDNKSQIAKLAFNKVEKNSSTEEE